MSSMDQTLNGREIMMDQTTLPTSLQEAVTVTTAGATGVAHLAIAGLLELVDDRPNWSGPPRSCAPGSPATGRSGTSPERFAATIRRRRCVGSATT